MEPRESDCCWNCKYFKGTHDDGKTKCGNPDQWNTWIKPQEGCEWWKEAHNDNTNQPCIDRADYDRHVYLQAVGQA